MLQAAGIDVPDTLRSALIDFLSIRWQDASHARVNLCDVMSIVLIMIKGAHLSDGVTTSSKVNKLQQ